MSLDPRCASSAARRCAHPGEFEQRVRVRGPEDLAILVYTSGTTGKSQGCDALAPRLICLHVRGANRIALPATTATSACASCRCATSPNAWAAPTSGHLQRRGAQLRREPGDRPRERARDRADTLFTAVPRVWEKFYSAVMIARQGVRQAAAGRLCLGDRRRPQIAEALVSRAVRWAGRCRSSVPLARAGWCSTTCAS
jgi:long-chain acyl-CoA synthetase